ncbi:MAG: Gx transporter family protein [Candidatus Merdivicinus sp.]|jgi:heptaprenyl diphosphate synthase
MPLPNKKHFSARSLASMGLLMALAAALNFAENLIPALPMMPPGVKLGLSNIVVAYCLFYLGRKEAAVIAVLKSGFVLLTRGVSAGAMSFCGGMLSLLVMMLAIRCTIPGKSRYFYVSIPGAVSHNIGQLLMASLLLKNTAVFYSLPVLLIAGVLMGCVTAILLRTVLPALRRISAAGGKQLPSGKDES